MPVGHPHLNAELLGSAHESAGLGIAVERVREIVGTIEKCDLISAAAKRAEEAEVMEKRDYVRALNDYMEPGRLMRVKDLVDIISTDHKYQHLFGSDKLTKSDHIVNKVVSVLKSDIVYEGKVFKYVLKANHRPKHWAICEFNDKDSEADKPKTIVVKKDDDNLEFLQ